MPHSKALAIAAAMLVAGSVLAQEPLPTIAAKTKGLTVRPGLIESYLDSKQGKVYLKLPPANSSGLVGEYLYVATLATGLGSNDLGIDRSGIGRTEILDIKTVGNKVLFEIPNLNFRASSPDKDQQNAVTEAFAPSILWAKEAVAADPDGSLLADITDFVVRDAQTVSEGLKGYTFDKDRSVLDPSQTKAFPENLEFQALLTFSTSGSGALVGDHAPESKIVTLAERQSIVKLPPPGYEPRKFDSRTGAFAISYLDFSAPLGQPLLQILATRHRLEKVDPTAARSKVKNPIVYYVDRGAPEPVRDALIQGGNYWAKAFDQAGFIDAFRVEEMPEGMDPLDVRYNTVMWLNRSTRGWAYGQSVVDPRTGEIIKGAVNLDSQRVRQDILIYEALLGADKTGKGGPNDPINIALSRARQLAAHEIGHTLGFQHNFAASTYGRASVMEYPAPLIKIGPHDALDLSDAYAQGVGAWDMHAVKWLYTEFPPGVDEKKGLEQIVQDGIKQKLVFLSDDDAEESGADPRANRWDNGNDPVGSLERSMRIRSIAMRRFGEHNIKQGEPLGLLEEVFGPLYFFHRYDIDAVSKMVGGVQYAYGVRGDGVPEARPLSRETQLSGLKALLACLKPDALDVPDSVANLLGIRPNGYPPSREEFARHASFVFDRGAAAEAIADQVLGNLTNPARCARIVELASRDPKGLGLPEVFSRISGSVTMPTGARTAELRFAVLHAWADKLMGLASSESASSRVAYAADGELRHLAGLLTAINGHGFEYELAAEIRRYLNRALEDPKRTPGPVPALPGSPIGG